MLPAIFGENLFDEMFDDMMRPMHSMEKALYGKHAKAIIAQKFNLKSATTRLNDTEAKRICIVSKRGHSAVTIKTYKCPLPHHAT